MMADPTTTFGSFKRPASRGFEFPWSSDRPHPVNRQNTPWRLGRKVRSKMEKRAQPETDADVEAALEPEERRERDDRDRGISKLRGVMLATLGAGGAYALARMISQMQMAGTPATAEEMPEPGSALAESARKPSSAGTPPSSMESVGPEAAKRIAWEIDNYDPPPDMPAAERAEFYQLKALPGPAKLLALNLSDVIKLDPSQPMDPAEQAEGWLALSRSRYFRGVFDIPPTWAAMNPAQMEGIIRAGGGSPGGITPANVGQFAALPVTMPAALASMALGPDEGSSARLLNTNIPVHPRIPQVAAAGTLGLMAKRHIPSALTAARTPLASVKNLGRAASQALSTARAAPGAAALAAGGKYMGAVKGMAKVFAPFQIGAEVLAHKQLAQKGYGDIQQATWGTPTAHKLQTGGQFSAGDTTRLFRDILASLNPLSPSQMAGAGYGLGEQMEQMGRETAESLTEARENAATSQAFQAARRQIPQSPHREILSRFTPEQLRLARQTATAYDLWRGRGGNTFGMETRTPVRRFFEGVYPTYTAGQDALEAKGLQPQEASRELTKLLGLTPRQIGELSAAAHRNPLGNTPIPYR